MTTMNPSADSIPPETAAPEAITSAARPLRFGAVILAAGQGSRLGGVAKPALLIDGEPLVARQARALREAGVVEVVVVLGHHAPKVQAALAGVDVRCVRNTAPDLNQAASVRAGLAALPDGLDGVLMVLGDQPLLGADDFLELVAAFGAHAQGGALVPWVETTNGLQRGNPVLIGGAVRAEVLAGGPESTVREWMRAHPARVYRHVTRNRSFLEDIDCVDDVERIAGVAGVLIDMPARWSGQST